MPYSWFSINTKIKLGDTTQYCGLIVKQQCNIYFKFVGNTCFNTWSTRQLLIRWQLLEQHNYVF